MDVLGIIPARGGSKGIPDKNLRLLAGKPLLTYTVNSAKASGVIDKLILSTDSERIADLGRRLGLEVPFIRPASLAADETPMLPVILHAVDVLSQNGWVPEIIVLLQPTSPLRSPDHIRKAVDLLKGGNCDSVISVLEIPHLFAPQKALFVQDGYLRFWSSVGKPITRRQQLETTYAREGTVYACLREVLIQKSSLYGDECLPLLLSSDESLNIDSMADWQKAEEILYAKERQPIQNETN
jgi:CMP-N-acetylneuraminic acid synthetase